MGVLKVLNLTVSNLGWCSGLERTDFNSFNFGKVWQSSKNRFLTVSTLGSCGSLEKSEFNSFYFARVWWY